MIAGIDINQGKPIKSLVINDGPNITTPPTAIPITRALETQTLAIQRRLKNLIGLPLATVILLMRFASNGTKRIKAGRTQMQKIPIVASIGLWLTLKLSNAVLASREKQKRDDHRRCAVASGSAVFFSCRSQRHSRSACAFFFKPQRQLRLVASVATARKLETTFFSHRGLKHLPNLKPHRRTIYAEQPQ